MDPLLPLSFKFLFIKLAIEHVSVMESLVPVGLVGVLLMIHIIIFHESSLNLLWFWEGSNWAMFILIMLILLWHYAVEVKHHLVSYGRHDDPSDSLVLYRSRDILLMLPVTIGVILTFLISLIKMTLLRQLTLHLKYTLLPISPSSS